MSQRRKTVTDSLTNIIQVIQLGRKTGQLVVERGEAIDLDEGEITFARGQIMQARSGYLTGQSALNWLCTWEACSFAFYPAEGSTASGPLSHPALPAQPISPLHNGAQFQPETSYPCPQRREAIERVLPLLDATGLTRHHRHLFLLVDGRRSIPELARLMGRKPDEVLRLLYDLIYLGVIQ